MIKLERDYRAIYIDGTSICLIGEDPILGTFVVLRGADNHYYVKETPEQILALMGIDTVLEVVDE